MTFGLHLPLPLHSPTPQAAGAPPSNVRLLSAPLPNPPSHALAPPRPLAHCVSFKWVPPSQARFALLTTASPLTPQAAGALR